MGAPVRASDAPLRESRPTSLRESDPKFGHVAALDGLRGIAVIAVIGYHLGTRGLNGAGFPGFSGGFLGVDLFFVLSGFLITSLLLNEHRRNGRIDLVAFWLRRARRLLPALFLLLAAVAGVAATRSPIERGTLRWDIFASLGYVLNWRFVISGQSYFDSVTTPSPLRHLWSLAIEEQFYLLWPLLVGGALMLVARYGRAASRAVTGLLLAGIAASAALLAITYTPADPSSAYYGTHTRVHELLIGAAAALFVAARRPDREASRHWLVRSSTLLSSGAVAASMLFLSDNGPAYYHGGSTLFSMAAAVVMVGVLDDRGLVARLLQWRPLTYVGSISYGLYLWHWPMITWVATKNTALSGAVLALLRLTLTVVAALLSFYLLERPVRSGSLRWLTVRPRTALVSIGTCLAVLVTTTAVATRGAQPIPAFLRAEGASVHVRSAPSNGTGGSVALIGDSVADNLAPYFQNEATRHGLASMTSTMPGCETGSLDRVQQDGHLLSGRNLGYCTEKHVKVWQKAVADFRPSIVFLHSRRDGYDILDKNGKHLLAGSDAWLAAVYAEWDGILAYLTAHGAKMMVLILPAYPAGETPGCETGGVEVTRSVHCGALPDDGFMGTGPLRYAYRTWAAKHKDKVRIFDLDQWLCPKPNGPCPQLINGQQMRFQADGIHFNEVGADYVVPKLFDQIGVKAGN